MRFNEISLGFQPFAKKIENWVWLRVLRILEIKLALITCVVQSCQHSTYFQKWVIQLYCKICNWSYIWAFGVTLLKSRLVRVAMSSQTLIHKTKVRDSYDLSFHPMFAEPNELLVIFLRNVTRWSPIADYCFLLSFARTYIVISCIILLMAWISSIPTQTNRIKCHA